MRTLNILSSLGMVVSHCNMVFVFKTFVPVRSSMRRIMLYHQSLSPWNFFPSSWPYIPRVMSWACCRVLASCFFQPAEHLLVFSFERSSEGAECCVGVKQQPVNDVCKAVGQVKTRHAFPYKSVQLIAASACLLLHAEGVDDTVNVFIFILLHIHRCCCRSCVAPSWCKASAECSP